MICQVDGYDLNATAMSRSVHCFPRKEFLSIPDCIILSFYRQGDRFSIFLQTATKNKNMFHIPSLMKQEKVLGLVRDLNPGPLAPKARIIPLDQRATYASY